MSAIASPREPASSPGGLPPAQGAAVDSLRYQRDGYVHVRSVLSSSEVALLREAVRHAAHDARERGRVLKPQTDEIVPVGDILGMDGVGWLLSDARIVDLARRALGQDSLVYFGDSGVMVGGKNRGFHKDNTVRDAATHPDWLGPYTLIRLGIYLDEHAEGSGGLKLREGSHLHADISSGRIVAVPSRPGDVLAWNLRTTHSGFAVRLRGLPNIGLSPRLEIRLPQALTRPGPEERVAVFITYGIRDHHLANYIAKHTSADYANNYLYLSWLHSENRPSKLAELEQAGVEFIRPIDEYGSQRSAARKGDAPWLVPGRGRPDAYPVQGLEKVIQTAGRGWRAARSLVSRS